MKMDFLQIRGGKRLQGRVQISGAKNAALPLIAASILAKNEVQISNLPQVSDIKTLIKLLNILGANTQLDASVLKVSTNSIASTKATYDIVRQMRASILVLGPLLARFGSCEVSLPGGCAIGARPIDLHLKALEKMGAKIEILDGYVKASGKLHGADIFFDKITVTGCENIIMAAALAQGVTRIHNAAKEPEVVQLCEVLANSGVPIEGLGTSQITIHGTDGALLDICDFSVIPDRIEAGTYACAAAITGGEVELLGAQELHLGAVIDKLAQMGVSCRETGGGIVVSAPSKLLATNLVTSEFPGFPTDMQAQFMALACVAQGTSVIDERLFENRFMHASELARMGAQISLNAHTATIEGGELAGADVMATDLRASSALVIAALKAVGTTRIHRIYHLDRGYEDLEGKLKGLDADIVRLKESV